MSIKCPYCGAENSGEFPFCKECGRVLPTGDEYEVLAESVGALFSWKWVFVGVIIILLLTSIIVGFYRVVGWDFSFMKAPNTLRIDTPQITHVSPEWLIAPSTSSLILTINTREKEVYTAKHALSAIVCGKSLKVIPYGSANILPKKINLLGIEMIRYMIPNSIELMVQLDEPLTCDQEGFYNVAVKYENGKKLYKYNALYIFNVKKPWYGFYMNLKTLKSYFDKSTNASILSERVGKEFKSIVDDVLKLLEEWKKQREEEKLLSLSFIMLFLLEILSFFLGGFISAWLSPGISIKETIVAALIAGIVIVLRNIYFFHAGGSFLILQLLIMLPLYSAISSFGGYMGEKVQGTLL